MVAIDVSERPLADLLSLDGRVAVVTGAARGIGLQVATRLAEAGASVLLGDLDKAAVEAAAERLTAAGRTAIGSGLDVADPDSVRDSIGRAVRELGGVDILVNNAGIYPPMPALAADDAYWAKVIGVNLTGAFTCAREAGAHMVQSGRGGVIVNICSTQSLKAGGPGVVAYTASKHGLAGLTKALAVELGPMGVRVLGVAPTMVETPGIDELRPMFEAAGVGDVIAQIKATLPLGRVATTDDVARIVVFAASDMAAIMTGSLLLADGGAMTL